MIKIWPLFATASALFTTSASLYAFVLGDFLMAGAHYVIAIINVALAWRYRGMET